MSDVSNNDSSTPAGEIKPERVERLILAADERSTVRYNERHDQLRGVSGTGLPEDNELSDLLKEGRTYGWDQGRAAGYLWRDAEVAALRAERDELREAADAVWQSFSPGCCIGHVDHIKVCSKCMALDVLETALGKGLPDGE